MSHPVQPAATAGANLPPPGARGAALPMTQRLPRRRHLE